MNYRYNFDCHDNASLTSFTATNCVQSDLYEGYRLKLYNNSSLTQVSLPGSIVNLEICNDEALRISDVTNYSSVRALLIHDFSVTSLDLTGWSALGYVSVYSLNNLTSLDFSRLQQLGNVHVYNCANLTNLNLDNTKSNGSFYI